MRSNVISTPNVAPPPPFYSHAVKAAGLVFVSGAAPSDPATGKLVEGTVQDQLAQCLRNISAILEAAGSSLDKAVSATVILADDVDSPRSTGSGSAGFPRTRPPAKAPSCRPRSPASWSRSR